jgi:hypothetical protein
MLEGARSAGMSLESDVNLPREQRDVELGRQVDQLLTDAR